MSYGNRLITSPYLVPRSPLRPNCDTAGELYQKCKQIVLKNLITFPFKFLRLSYIQAPCYMFAIAPGLAFMSRYPCNVRNDQTGRNSCTFRLLKEQETFPLSVRSIPWKPFTGSSDVSPVYTIMPSISILKTNNSPSESIKSGFGQLNLTYTSLICAAALNQGSLSCCSFYQF